MFTNGEAPERLGQSHRGSAPYQLFATADGYMTIGAASEAFWQTVCRVLGCEELTQDPAVPDQAGPGAQRPRAGGRARSLVPAADHRPLVRAFRGGRGSRRPGAEPRRDAARPSDRRPRDGRGGRASQGGPHAHPRRPGQALRDPGRGAAPGPRSSASTPGKSPGSGSRGRKRRPPTERAATCWRRPRPCGAASPTAPRTGTGRSSR